MGSRNANHTALAILAAFLRERSWRQDELAADVGVQTDTIRKHLLSLQHDGVPLERDEEDGRVYWSVPKGWAPRGAFIEQEDLAALLALLVRHPKSAARDRIVKQFLKVVPTPPSSEVWKKKLAVVLPGEEPVKAEVMDALEDHAARQVASRINYYAPTNGVFGWRTISVQRIVPPQRAVIWHHGHGELRWFRLDRIEAIEADESVQFHAAPAEAVAALLKESVSGFASDEPATDHTFIVRAPDARWVSHNLPFGDGAVVRSVPGDALRVTVRTSALVQVARYVVGLGGIARAETPELARAVVALATEAIRAQEEALSIRTFDQSPPTQGADGGEGDSWSSSDATTVVASSADGGPREER